MEYGGLRAGSSAVVVEPRRRDWSSRIAEAVRSELRPLLFALRRLANPQLGGRGAARASADLRIARLRTLLMEPLGVAG